jgi:hypothetical protein
MVRNYLGLEFGLGLGSGLRSGLVGNVPLLRRNNLEGFTHFHDW